MQTSNEHICLICNTNCITGKKFSNHLKKDHNLTSEEYSIKHILSNTRPICLVCGIPTRYVAFTFKKYCKEHASIASIEGGKRGGKASAWNKGLTSNTDERVKKQAVKMLGSGNHFWGKNHTQETIKQISLKKTLGSVSIDERIKKRESEFELITSVDDYHSRQMQYLVFKCKVCNTEQNKTLQAFERGSLCQKCFPNSSSRAELEIGDYIGSLGLIPKRNDRTIINPKELDVLVEDKKAAFEYDGLYWHNDNSGKPRDYHYNKTKDCHAAGYSLFRIYSDQWENKNELVRAMIRCRLGIISKKIHARECQVTILDQSLSKGFFDKNHLYGSSPSKITFGLLHNNELVSAVSMRIPRQEKYKQEDFIEICRFASSYNTIVVGGFSKIFKQIKSWSIENSFKNILTYADLDTGTGNVYEKSGFQLMGETGPAYWYSDGQKRFDRFKFRAQNNKTEMQIANDAGVVRIYGAGSKIYKYVL